MAKPMIYNDPPVAKNATIADEVKYTTCYMCACRCGIKVSLRDGAIRYIEGNRRHPVNRGVLCPKGYAGIVGTKYCSIAFGSGSTSVATTGTTITTPIAIVCAAKDTGSTYHFRFAARFGHTTS